MSSYVAFTKKEFLEAYRTWKVLLFCIISVIIGMMNPLFAKLTPKILKSIDMQGISITIPEPTAMDSWTQFFKNVPQFELIVLVIIFSGILSNEISKGTLVNMLTKGLRRSTVILAKMTMATCIWSVSFFLTFAISYGYTKYYWPDETCEHIGIASVSLWIFGIFLITCILLGSVLLKGMAGSLLMTGGAVAVMLLFNIIPKVSEWNPIMLVSSNMKVIQGTIGVDDMIKPVVITCIVGITFLISSCGLFNKKMI